MAGRQDPGAYSAIFVTEGYAEMQASFLQLHDLLEISGYPNLGQLLRTAFVRFKADVERIAQDIAIKATAYIKDIEATSRVRPDSGGDDTGKRLGDYVGESQPLTAVPGSVGVNYEPTLYDNVSWWWTNEEGYSGHVGRVVHGFFFESGYTGRSRPDIGSFREHPLFRAEGRQRPNSYGSDDRPGAKDPPKRGLKGERPGMLIQNPIPPREFVLRGSQQAEAEWHTAMSVAKARFDKEMARISALIVPKP